MKKIRGILRGGLEFVRKCSWDFLVDNFSRKVLKFIENSPEKLDIVKALSKEEKDKREYDNALAKYNKIASNGELTVPTYHISLATRIRPPKGETQFSDTQVKEMRDIPWVLHRTLFLKQKGKKKLGNRRCHKKCCPSDV